MRIAGEAPRSRGNEDGLTRHRQGSLHLGCLLNSPFSFILTSRTGVCSGRYLAPGSKLAERLKQAWLTSLPYTAETVW